MMIYVFIKIIMKKSSCYFAIFIGNCDDMLFSEMEEVVAIEFMKENKCWRKAAQILEILAVHR